jgi:hypothetical protein
MIKTNSTTTAHTLLYMLTHNSADELDWIRAFSSTVVDAVETEEACAAVDSKRKRRPHETATTAARVQRGEHVGASTSTGIHQRFMHVHASFRDSFKDC